MKKRYHSPKTTCIGLESHTPLLTASEKKFTAGLQDFTKSDESHTEGDDTEEIGVLDGF